VVWTSYPKDPATRWTAVAAIVAGVALFVAVIGLPLALLQLATVQEDLDRLTTATDMEKRLRDYLIDGSRLAREFLKISDNELRAQLYEWIEQVARVIRVNTDEVEDNLFRLAGDGYEPVDELRSKIAFVRNDLMPKIRAGYWEPLLAPDAPSAAADAS
jgi:hypothetical protein